MVIKPSAKINSLLVTIALVKRYYCQVANDTETLTGFDKAKDLFMPVRLDGKKGLAAFEQLLDTITQGIHGHFSLEEGSLMHIFGEHGDKKLSTVLHSLLLEHEDLKDRLAYTKQDVGNLLNDKLPCQKEP